VQIGAVILTVGSVAALIAQTLEILPKPVLPFQLPDQNKPGFDMYGRQILQQVPRYPLDLSAPSMTGNNGDGVAQVGERIGQNNEGELTADLERKQQLVKELVPVYQKAFAGPPWFEVSKCLTCPTGFSASPAGDFCEACSARGVRTLLTSPAYPPDELYAALLERVRSPDSTVYIERTVDGKPVLSAIFKVAEEQDIVSNYAGRTDPDIVKSIIPGRVLWLDEIFADLDARPNGNLKNLQEIIEKSAQQTGDRTIAFRTINENLIKKMQNIYGPRATITMVPDSGVSSGVSALVVIKL
jgi:hypothetical protein